jgi:hypothetical protein
MAKQLHLRISTEQAVHVFSEYQKKGLLGKKHAPFWK